MNTFFGRLIVSKFATIAVVIAGFIVFVGLAELGINANLTFALGVIVGLVLWVLLMRDIWT